MFKLSVQTGGPEEDLGIDGAYRLIAETGFDAVDANVDHLFSYQDIRDRKVPSCFLPSASDAEVTEAFRPWGDAAGKYGIENFQAHAPFPTQINDGTGGEFDDILISMLEKCIRGSDSIGCRNLIVHPFHMRYPYRPEPAQVRENNLERYSRLIPAAKQYGVTINLENMFTDYKGKIMASACNNPAEAAEWVDELNRIAGEKVFGFCLDVGHATLCGLDIKSFMLTLGDRITSFHVHDNDGVHDSHLQPYSGVTDWDRFIEGLREIRYHSTLSFETFRAWTTVPPEAAPAMLSYILACGKCFQKRAAQ